MLLRILLAAPAINGGIFRRTVRKAAGRRPFNHISGISFVWNENVGKFQVKGPAGSALQPPEQENLDFSVGHNDAALLAVTDTKRTAAAGTAHIFVRNSMIKAVLAYNMVFFHQNHGDTCLSM